MERQYDFCGWATKNDLLCSDGRTIRRNAFKECDGKTVPLVWAHDHDSPFNVLGHALLENRDEGVYAYGYFNDSESGNAAKTLVAHGDISAMSIYANKLKQHGGDVIHGIIREVSLVYAGANPGAHIDSVMTHSDDEEEFEATIYTGENFYLEHEDSENNLESNDKGENEMDKAKESEGKSIKDILATFNGEQLDALYAVVGLAVQKERENDEEKGADKMKHNVFEDNEENSTTVLSHDDMKVIMSDAKRCGSLKESVLQHTSDYGIENIDWLFPEAKNLNNPPEIVKRTPDAWVDVVMKGVHHTPFSRIKSMFADITEAEARAKGYTKGNLKTEEVIGLIKRSTTPTTVYKKQKLDRDDVNDITDFDVVAFMKAEMRTMLDEELARAFLFGDGRSTVSSDKISESNIRPVLKDTTDNFYAMEKTVTVASGEATGHAIINTVVKAQNDYKGSGNITLFTSPATITDMLLLEDTTGHRLYKDVKDLALAMNISNIVRVPADVIPSGYYGVALDLRDYNVGADKGGSVNMFDDFDIDYNQMKYLIETRCSGALIKPYSAIVLKAASST